MCHILFIKVKVIKLKVKCSKKFGKKSEENSEKSTALYLRKLNVKKLS